MTDEAAPQENEALRFSQVLQALAEAEGDKVSVNDIVRAFGERAFGALMLTVGLLNMLPWPPGGTTVVGAPLLFITLQLAIGREQLWLPRWLCRASFSRPNFRNGLRKVQPWLQKAERLTKPRLPWAVTGVAERLIGVAGLLLTCVLVLPIPFGNFAPAITISLFAIGLVQRDGVAALLGWAATAVSVGILVLAGKAIWELFEAGLAFVQRLSG